MQSPGILPNKVFDHPLTILLLSHYVNSHYGVGWSPGWQPTLCVAWRLIWWFASLEKSMVIHDTKCPYWGQMLLNNTSPTQPCKFCKVPPPPPLNITLSKKYGHTWHQMSFLRPDVIKQQFPTQPCTFCKVPSPSPQHHIVNKVPHIRCRERGEIAQ